MDSKYLESFFGLSGKVAAITGGGGVLCGTMSRSLGRMGVKVAVLDIMEEAAQRVVDDIAAQAGEAIAVQCDVLERTSLEAARDVVLDRLGRVDIVINGAGGNKKEASTSDELSFFDVPADALRWVFNLNCVGTMLTSQVFGQPMVDQDEGCILNISSMSALSPLTRIPAYSAAKGAVSNFTQWLAVHMAQEYSPNIRVNALAPGFFLTEQNRFLLYEEETGDYTARGRSVIAHTPMGRFGDPEDLLGATVWLLSPAASFVTGIIVPIDGGFSAFSV